ncbi:hypothetical protein QJS66_15860 [Kocuria rhizophila]|nr:hypothetical protein QJS66_15860 [Kocuria rhizophila]
MYGAGPAGDLRRRADATKPRRSARASSRSAWSRSTATPPRRPHPLRRGPGPPAHQGIITALALHPGRGRSRFVGGAPAGHHRRAPHPLRRRHLRDPRRRQRRPAGHRADLDGSRRRYALSGLVRRPPGLPARGRGRRHALSGNGTWRLDAARALSKHADDMRG